jgi:hypothetical protein
MARLQWQAGMVATLGEFVEPASESLFGYECTTAGTAGTHEPDWPEVAGNTVVDGSIVWTARAAQTITWQAASLYKSGAAQPSWPESVGGTVLDGTITWKAETPAITDAVCPQSTIAFPLAHKVFSPKDDVLRYCVTDDPRDWHTQDDAGFLSTGLSLPEDPKVRALGEFRGRLAVWTAAGLEIWNADPDPANMSLFDTIPGIGTIHPSVASVSGDLFMVTKVGIRSLSVAAGAQTLQSGDVGAAIDDLVVAKVRAGQEPLMFYFPGSAQLWAAFGNEVFVYSQSRLGKIGAWSRYLFPYSIDAVAQLDGFLYLRAGDDLYYLDETMLTDDGVAFQGVVWWPHLDCGNPGRNKQLLTVDVVGYGSAKISIGFDQTNDAAYTTPLQIPQDTLVGGAVPIPVVAPSLAVKLTFDGAQAWQVNAVRLDLVDLK